MASPITPQIPLSSRILMRVIGVVLIIAGGLKATGTDDVSVVAGTKLELRTEAKSALVSLEVLLGVWFLSGFGARAARWAAVVVFTVFTVASGSAVAAGSPTCGCLGGAKVNPAVVLTFDVAVLLLLVLMPFRGAWQPADRLAARIAGGTAALGALGAGVAVLWFGSWFVATAALRDQPMAVDPVVISVGKCRAGQTVEAIVTFTNMTDDRIQVILIQSDCSCVSADVPVWVEPGEARRVRVEVRPPSGVGPFVRNILWLTTAGQWRGELRGELANLGE